eukprot:CCRYP_005522-RA/>CCRYP_005522-RA protein AED:0.39 eAED:0.63 QI:0/-1/0/1/-1/0/1/0/124
MNLYLYLPPTSSHPKGIGTGLIFGQVLRYRCLSTHQCDADKKIREFYQRLLARGHSPDTLSPLFLKAERNAKAYLTRSHKDHEALKKARQRTPLTRCSSICDTILMTHLPNKSKAYGGRMQLIQ